MEDKFLTVQEMAQMLKVNKMTIYRYIKAGKIVAVKIGKDYRITKKEFNQFINKNNTKEGL